MFNFFARKPISSGILPYYSDSFIVSNGNIISDDLESDQDRIYKNICVRTIINKQTSIISEGAIEVRERNKNNSDEKSTNPLANKFIEYINSPNSYPSPYTIKHIFNYLLEGYWVRGIAGLIFHFDSVNKMSTFNHISYAYDIEYNDDYYKASTLNKDQNLHSIQFNKTNGLYIDKDNKMVLFVISEFNWCSPFQQVIEYILLNNIVIKYNGSYFNNNCMPAQIVSVSYKDSFLKYKEGNLSEKEMQSFRQQVSLVKDQFRSNKGVSKSGSTAFMSDPNLQIDVQNLSLPNNSGETKTMWELTSDAIFSIVDGGSRGGYQALKDYSGNTINKQKEIYDGAFRIAKSTIIDQMTIFLRKLLSYNNSNNFSNIYVYLNTKTVEIYRQNRIEQSALLYEKDGITLGEFRKAIKETDDMYSDLKDLGEREDKLHAEIKGEQTRANFDTMNKVSQEKL